MISAFSLWLPIVLSAVFVFITSSFIHMVLKFHARDYKAVPAEDDVMDALHEAHIAEGEYFMPFSSNSKQRETIEYRSKMHKGPVAFLTVISADYNMGGKLFMWFIYILLVGLCTAYVAGISIQPGAEYMVVFRLTGTVAFIGYALALMQNSIWHGKSWGNTLKSMIDGFVYALLTAGTFGWLWP